MALALDNGRIDTNGVTPQNIAPVGAVADLFFRMRYTNLDSIPHTLILRRDDGSNQDELVRAVNVPADPGDGSGGNANVLIGDKVVLKATDTGLTIELLEATSTVEGVVTWDILKQS